MTTGQRTFLNAILSFIGATSLTDDEAAAISLTGTGTFYDSESFGALLGTLDSRGAVSSVKGRLRNFYLAKGVPVGEPESVRTNIFIGASLGDDIE